MDFVYCAVTPQDLGSPTPSVEDAVALVRELPFIQCMRLLSAVAGAVYHAHRSSSAQRKVVDLFYGPSPDVHGAVLAWVDGEPNRLAFDRRHIAVLQQLLILHANGEDHRWTPQHHGRLIDSLLAVAGAFPHGEPEEELDPAHASMEGWTRYLTRVGLYYDQPWIAQTLARSWSQYVEIATETGDRKEACEIDGWLRADYGLGLAEQVGVGLAYAHGSGAFVPTLTPEERLAHRPRPGYLRGTALEAQEPQALRLLSADRDELRATVAATADDPMRLAWDHTALEAKPFLRDEEGFLVLHSPQALMSWMTRGGHYRALDAANRRTSESGKPLGGRWLQYAGTLGEESVRKLMRGSIPSDGMRGRLHGEIRFGHGGQNHSPDAAVELWPDLALFEVYSGRFSREARGGDPARLSSAIRRATVAKLNEVLDRAEDVLPHPVPGAPGSVEKPRLTYPGAVDVPRVVWPVVVLAGDTITPTPMLWRWLAEELGDRIGVRSDPRIRRPTIVDLDDLEPLLSLVEAGHSLFALLDAFLSSDLAEFPLRNWIAREFDLDRDHPRYVAQQWKLAATAGALKLYPGSTKLATVFQPE